MTDQVGVIGAGAWGTTLAIRLAEAERPVTLWAHSAEANEELASRRENVRYLPGFVLAASDAQAVVIGQLECFPTGFAFDLRTTSRYEVALEEEDEPMRDPFFPRRRRAVGPEELRFGIEYSNGKKATNFDPHDWESRFDRQPRDAAPHLDGGGGGGGGGNWRHEFWVWPLPPDGPVIFACEWPAYGIQETTRRVAGERFRRAAEKSKPLFK